MEIDELYRIIGENIRRKRIEKGLSQEQLSEKAGITPSFLSDIENNKKQASLKTLFAIANGLSVPIEELLTAYFCEKGVSLQDVLKALNDCRRSTNHLFDILEKLAKDTF